jgi:hypothetical protein
VAGVQLNNNTESTKPERNEQGRKKYEDRLEMSVHNGHVRVVTGAWLRDFSTSGLPVVGGSIYDTSIMHGHSGTSDLFILVWYGHI